MKKFRSILLGLLVIVSPLPVYPVERSSTNAGIFVTVVAFLTGLLLYEKKSVKKIYKKISRRILGEKVYKYWGPEVNPDEMRAAAQNRRNH